MTPGGYPAASAQRGLWLTQMMDPASPAYLIVHTYEISGPLDTGALCRAVDVVVQRHDTLRSSFERRDDDVFVLVHPARPFEIEIEDLSGSEDVDAALAAVLDAERRTPFDLARAPLVRVRLLRTASQRHVLVLAVHHIAADGASVELIWRDLADCYEAALTGADPRLAPLEASYADFAAHERDWSRSADHAKQLAYWTGRLRGAPAIDLPVREDAGTAWHGGLYTVWLSEEDTAALMRLTREQRVTPFITMLTIYAGVLHRWSGQSDVIVASPVAVRDLPGAGQIVGMLVNTVALRTTWDDDPTAAQALDRVLTATAEGLGHRAVPFDHVVNALPAAREPGRAPVTQVLFGYATDDGSGGLRLPGLRVRHLPAVVDTAKFELTLDCLLVEGRIMCAFEWSEQRLDLELVEIFAEHFVAAARFVAAHPRARVGEWPLTPDEPVALPEGFAGAPGRWRDIGVSAGCTFPLSAHQRSVLAHEQTADVGSAYHIAAAYEVTGELRTDLLGEALRWVADRHESLRTVFRTIDGEPRQVVLPEVDLTVVTVDDARDEAERPFALEQGPLLRVLLEPLGERRWRLLLVMHHLIGDGWSLGVLVDDLAARYGELAEGLTMPGGRPPQFADFTLWEAESIPPAEIDRQIRYWRTQLGTTPANLELCPWRARPSRWDNRIETAEFTVDAGTTEALARFARERGATMHMAVLAAFQLAVARRCGRERFVLGGASARRTTPELAGVVGLVANFMLPVVADLTGAPSYAQVLDRVRTQTIDALSHQDVPIDVLLAAVDPGRGPGVPPTWQVGFQLWPAQALPPVEVAGVRFEAAGATTAHSYHEFALTVVHGDDLRCAVQWTTAHHDTESVRGVVTEFTERLAAAVREPDSPIRVERGEARAGRVG